MFTKGPWKLIDDCIRSPDMAGISDQMADYRGAIICDMSAGLGHSLGERYLSRRHALPETRANAHLIAASPDLYEALKHLVEYIDKEGPAAKEWKAITEWCEKGEQAILKAEGKS